VIFSHVLYQLSYLGIVPDPFHALGENVIAGFGNLAA
jgi:hypothetical protein